MKNGIKKSHLLKTKVFVCLLSFKYSFYEMKFYAFNTSSDKVSVHCSLSLRILNTEHTPLIKKKRSTGPVSDQSTDVDFEIYRSGRENFDRFHL